MVIGIRSIFYTLPKFVHSVTVFRPLRGNFKHREEIDQMPVCVIGLATDKALTITAEASSLPILKWLKYGVAEISQRTAACGF